MSPAAELLTAPFLFFCWPVLDPDGRCRSPFLLALFLHSRYGSLLHEWSLLTQRGLYKNARRAPARICIPTRPSPACPLQILLGTLPLPDADRAGRQAAHEAGRQLAWTPVELLDGLTDGACWAILSVHLRPASLFPQG